MNSKGSWRKIATTAASRRRVMGLDENGGASATKARGRREGRKAHAGHSLMQVASPDEVMRHRPSVCEHCQQPLEGIAGHVKERRQIHDLPEVRLVVREHQVEEVCCPVCQHVSRGSFPAGVEAAVQYGSTLRALAVYLHEYQLVPLGRVSELLADLYSCHVSEGTLVTWVDLAAERLAPTVARIADWLSVGPLQHADETGSRIWLGMASEDDRRSKTLASGRDFGDVPYGIAGPAMITTTAPRASVEPIWCAIASMSTNRSTSPGRRRWRI